jgi:hypothetical protein
MRIKLKEGAGREEEEGSREERYREKPTSLGKSDNPS